MKRIGVLADTHGYLDPLLLTYFAHCDEIWHAGDFGTEAVADQLAACQPLRGVYGNIDDVALRARFPRNERFRCEELDVWMTHIAGRPDRYEQRIARTLRESPPGLLICGHSHCLQVQRDPQFGSLVFLNPGAAGHAGFHLQRTAILLEIDQATIQRVQAIDLGPRGRVPSD